MDEAKLVHIVTLECKSSDDATKCLEALKNYGRPDALAYKAVSYEFGLKEGSETSVYIVERWRSWDDLNKLLTEKVVPALPLYNSMLKSPFDPAKDTLRITLK